MTPKKISYENRAKTIIKNFEKRGIKGYYCETPDDGVKMAMSLMKGDSTVAFGGSETLKETGMLEALKNSEHIVIDRMTAKTPEEKREVYGRSVMADDYLMSSNAVTLGGELVNIDGNGNRVACLITGPKQVILLVGMNKVVKSVEEAIERVRNFAAPPNGVRLDLKTPCTVNGICSDCYSPDCMCAQIVITRKCKPEGRIKVILIGEELGY